MGFKEIAKGVGGEFWHAGRAVVAGPEKPKMSSEVPKDAGIRAEIPRRKKWETVREAIRDEEKRRAIREKAQEKPKLQEKPKGDSIFGNKSYLTREERMTWLKKHKGEIYNITHGRVTEGKLNEFDEELWQKYKKQGGMVTKKDIMRDISGIIPDLERNRYYKAKTSGEKYDIKEDEAVVKKMLESDLDQAKK